jgi:hypothetical protein
LLRRKIASYYERTVETMMSIGLQVSRFGRIGAFPTREYAGGDLYDLSREHADFLHKNQILDAVDRSVDSVFSKLTPGFKEISGRSAMPSENPPEIISSNQKCSAQLANPIDRPVEYKTYMTQLPARVLAITFSGRTWNLRTQASFSISSATFAPARLWWTTEGVQIPAANLSPGGEFGNFMQLADRIERAALEVLSDPFNKWLEYKGFRSEMSEPFAHDIRIRLADDQSRPFAALTDALYLSRQHPSEISEHNASDGLRQFKRFVAEVSDKAMKVTDENVAIYRDVMPGVSSVVCQDINPDTSLTIGLARSASKGHAYRIHHPVPFAELSTDLTGTMSPSRRFSTYLAALEERKLLQEIAALAHH